MKHEFEYLSSESTSTTIESALMVQRPRLANAIKTSTSPYAYLLQGNNHPNHKDTSDDWLVLIRKDDGWLIISDSIISPNKNTNNKDALAVKLLASLSEEQYSEIFIGTKAMKNLFFSLLKAYNVDIVSIRQKGGRPRKYKEDDAKRIVELKAQGMSNRAISRQEKMSPATVADLLNKYKFAQIFSGEVQDNEQQKKESP